MARALKHERCSTPGCMRKGQTHRPEFEGRCKRCFAGSLPEGQPCVNAHLGCTRQAMTDRPCYEGRCQTCYNSERKGLPFVPSSYRRYMGRCPICEALLAYVEHEGGVCMMQRCRREAAA